MLVFNCSAALCFMRVASIQRHYNVGTRIDEHLYGQSWISNGDVVNTQLISLRKVMHAICPVRTWNKVNFKSHRWDRSFEECDFWLVPIPIWILCTSWSAFLFSKFPHNQHCDSHESWPIQSTSDYERCLSNPSAKVMNGQQSPLKRTWKKTKHIIQSSGRKGRSLRSPTDKSNIHC